MYKYVQDDAKIDRGFTSNEACEWVAIIDNSKDKIFEPREEKERIIYII